MNILHISSVRSDYHGGTEKIIRELAKRQAKKNKVTILQTNLYQEEERIKKIEYKDNIKIITCKNDFFLGGFGYSSEFKRKLSEIWREFDIVHIHGHGRFTSNFSMGFLQRKKPFIYSAQGFFHDKKNSFFKKAYNILFGNRLKKASVCTALTKLERDYLIEKFGIKEGKIRIVPGGINLKDFQRINPREIRKFKKRFGLQKEPILLYVGRIHESKGLISILEVVKDINCQFLIVGKNAGYKQILEKYAKTNHMGKKVVFTGSLNEQELARAYKSANIFVLYSDWEGFGIAVIEAMASGIPVIVSDKGALPLLVKNNLNGFIAKNKEDLRNKIKALINNRKKRNSLSDNGLKYVRKFDWDKINKEVLDIYSWAIKRKNEN